MASAPEPRCTPEEYLARERAASHKSEFFRGRMFAMAGASTNHNRLVRNILTHLDTQLRGKGCEVFPSDLRLSCPSGLMTYPDIQVICGPLEYVSGTNDTVTNPRLIVEVLSKSTESYDRGQKFEYYRDIPSLQEYVLVAYREPLVERFVRQLQGGWLLTEARGLENSLKLDAIHGSLPLSEVFRDVAFPALSLTLWHEE
jgi:Uma2 family endonuclease